MRGQVTTWEFDELSDPPAAVVVVDVLRAFTTAAYAFDAGASSVRLVGEVADALRLAAADPTIVVIGEDRGRRPVGFDLPNSPARVHEADLGGRTVVLRTSAGTRGVLQAVSSPSRPPRRVWAAGLVCASATAAALAEAALEPTYLITGCFADDPQRTGNDDRLAATCIESARTGRPVDREATAASLRSSFEASRLATLGTEHADPRDVDFAADLDRFGFAMEVDGDGEGTFLRRGRP